MQKMPIRSKLILSLSKLNPNLFLGLKKLGGFFNLSMSYRHDADLHIPYGRITRIQDHPVGQDLENHIKEFGRINANMSGKEEPSQPMIAQFVSNCGSQSGREKLLQSLQKILPVDVYGGCGKLQCPRSSSDQCLEMLGSRYKFYLSLENAVCKGYVTEKFFNILPYNTIPVVLNGADMSSIAPPHSYINIQDFPTTAKLAEYLRKVGEDDQLFASYFWWRSFYKVQVRSDYLRQD